MTLLTGLLPAAVAVAERFGDPPGAELLPAEREVVERAVEQRRREFTTARACAREALAALGEPAAPILPLGGSGPRWARRAPAWPPGVVGSLTHCAGYRAAAVARSQEVRSVGIDAEPHEPLPDGVLRLVASDGERAALAGLGGGVAWGRVLFSAKEAVYKAWFPLTGSWLDFGQCVLTLDRDGTFVGRVRAAGPVTAFAGRWRVAGEHVVTAVAVPAG